MPDREDRPEDLPGNPGVPEKYVADEEDPVVSEEEVVDVANPATLVETEATKDVVVAIKLLQLHRGLFFPD